MNPIGNNAFGLRCLKLHFPWQDDAAWGAWAIYLLVRFGYVFLASCSMTRDFPLTFFLPGCPKLPTVQLLQFHIALSRRGLPLTVVFANFQV